MWTAEKKALAFLFDRFLQSWIRMNSNRKIAREENTTVVRECCGCLGGALSKFQLLIWRRCRFGVLVIITDLAAMPLVEHLRIVSCHSSHFTSEVLN